MEEKRKVEDIPEIQLSRYNIDAKVISLVPPSLAEKYKLIPIFKVGNVLTVAMTDPKNVAALDEVCAVTKMDVQAAKVKIEEMNEALSQYYGIFGIVEDVLKKYRRPDENVLAKAPTHTEAPVVKLVDAIVSQAVREKASDIHIESEPEIVRVRYRIDGILHEEITMPYYMLSPIVSRIKILSHMDISESRVPQDGGFEIKYDNRTIDFRVSTFPCSEGEKVVMRILDTSSVLYRLTEIGFSKENSEKFEKLIHRPHGIILVTGPTGSGKTTTLYSALHELNSKELNIVTIEDPVEYEIRGINQSQINVKAGMTFASALRAILRQDPDVILVGEIRDSETVEIAIQASLTGHLVFSTLHTNDAASALTRLIDMGVESYLLSSTIIGILAQRLVRIICKSCKEECPAPEDLQKKYPDIKAVYRGAGCKVCHKSGYKGRTGIFEFLVLDDEIKKMISEHSTAADIRKYAMIHGMKTIHEDGIDKIREGVTTLDEVMRVTERD